ncbi:UNVERIFIED_CONTAM: hypothetical protein RKD50_006665 [Streptomyces canus]
MGSERPVGYARPARRPHNDCLRRAHHAVDGKSARGSCHGDIPAAHLLAAVTGTGLIVTQLRVPDKTNEYPCSSALLVPCSLIDSFRRPLDLLGLD